jgi:hypothetical protein
MSNIGRVVPLLWGKGWFPLTHDDVDANVESFPGSYVLAILHGRIIVKTRTGSSGNLNRRLHDHVYDGRYDAFRFKYEDDMENDEELSEELLTSEDEIYDSTHGVIGLGHGEKERPKRHRV